MPQLNQPGQVKLTQTMRDFSVSPTAASVAQTKADSLQVEQTFHKVAGLQSINVASNLRPLVKHDFNPQSRLGGVAISLLFLADERYTSWKGGWRETKTPRTTIIVSRSD